MWEPKSTYKYRALVAQGDPQAIDEALNILLPEWMAKRKNQEDINTIAAATFWRYCLERRYKPDRPIHAVFACIRNWVEGNERRKNRPRIGKRPMEFNEPSVIDDRASKCLTPKQFFDGQSDGECMTVAKDFLKYLIDDVVPEKYRKIARLSLLNQLTPSEVAEHLDADEEFQRTFQVNWPRSVFSYSWVKDAIHNIRKVWLRPWLATPGENLDDAA